MSELFYIAIYILSIYNFVNLSSFNKIFNIRNWTKSYIKVTKKIPELKDYRDVLDYQLFLSWSIMTILNFILSIIGLMSQHWILFLVLMSIIGIIGRLNKLIKNESYIFIFEFLRDFSVSFILLNISIDYFHNFNMLNWFFNLIKSIII